MKTMKKLAVLLLFAVIAISTQAQYTGFTDHYSYVVFTGSNDTLPVAKTDMYLEQIGGDLYIRFAQGSRLKDFKVKTPYLGYANTKAARLGLSDVLYPGLNEPWLQTLPATADTFTFDSIFTIVSIVPLSTNIDTVKIYCSDVVVGELTGSYFPMVGFNNTYTFKAGDGAIPIKRLRIITRSAAGCFFSGKLY